MSGKQYNNEKAIISLTSWKERIVTVSQTIVSLLKNCPGFHIVLVLSEDEFPKKEDDFPLDLKCIIQNNLIELLWVQKNYLSYKKVFFTMDKYRNVPIISVDDGQIYVRNVAEDLYNIWKNNTNKIVANTVYWCDYTGGCGASGICYPPFCFNTIAIKILDENFDKLMKNSNDDRFIAVLSKFLNIDWIENKNKKEIYKIISHDILNGMNRNKKFIPGSTDYFLEIIKKYFE